MGKISTVHLPNEVPRRGGVRYCDEPGCGKQLSMYNLGPRCHSHPPKNKLGEKKLQDFKDDLRRYPIPVTDDLRDLICQAACGHFSYALSVLRSTDSHKGLVKARQSVMYLLYHIGKVTEADIGEHLHRDKATVKSNLQRVETNFADFFQDLQEIRTSVRMRQAP